MLTVPQSKPAAWLVLQLPGGLPPPGKYGGSSRWSSYCAGHTHVYRLFGSSANLASSTSMSREQRPSQKLSISSMSSQMPSRFRRSWKRCNSPVQNDCARGCAQSVKAATPASWAACDHQNHGNNSATTHKKIRLLAVICHCTYVAKLCQGRVHLRCDPSHTLPVPAIYRMFHTFLVPL